MDIEPQNFFQILKDHSNNVLKGPFECDRLLSVLNYNLTEEQLNSSLIDLYVHYAFDKNNGLFSFILDVVSNNKFDSAVCKGLEIIFTLINNFCSKIEPYILDINEKCLKVVQSKGSAKVKSKALEVLLVSFEKVDKCLEYHDKYLDIFNGIKRCLAIDHADSVKAKEFVVLGLFTKRFSYLLNDSNSIKAYFTTQLNNQMAVKDKSQGALNGIFTGFGYFCESFPLNLDNRQDVEIVERLYKHIKDLSQPASRIKTGNRAAIIFFGNNMKLFMRWVIEDCKKWHKKLFIDWFAYGAEEKKAAEQTLKTLLFNVSEELVSMEKNKCLPLLRHFINWLKSLMRNPNSTNTEKRLAIQGFKYFCYPLYRHYSKEEAREVFLLVMNNFENIYVLNKATRNEEWEFLPDYVQCLASFMRFQSFSTSEIYCLQRAVINMIKTFDKLKPLHHHFVVDAIITTLFYLKKTDHFDAFVENIVYQGVVWSCSHHHITDSELSTDTEKIVTVKSFFSLWQGLLKLTTNRSYDKYSIFFEERKYILTKIINELVKTLMILINKLNVSVRLKEDIIQTDIESAYQVEQSSDFAIFLNVTDFYQEIFNYIDAQMFKYCIFRMINHLVAKCFRFPLVSGFYKLLSFALKIADNLKLFYKENITLNQDVINCRETISMFLPSLLHKLKQFKDELLIAALHVLLESPVIVVEPLLPECAGIFITIFEVGRSYIALANLGLTTLERWQNNMNKEEFEAFLIKVIPCLDSYLRSKSLGGLMQTSTVEKKRKTAQALKKRTVLVELEPELVKFQKRVLHFIGSQNSKICQAFVSPENDFERKVTSDNLHLKLSLPYDDVTLEMYLEPFVLRIIDLAMYCSDRNTRVMACELLQAVVMVFLGRTKQLTHSGLTDLEELLKFIAMPLLQLSCDADLVVKQIFEPLFMQLIHWYTSKTQKEGPHSAVIIQVLLEGVTHPTNTSLRDFSGKCLNEFVKWTIKQTSEKDLANPTYIKALVKRMRFFSGHPDPIKKLGAALIFNNIYKEIREERVLVNIFSIELLHIFITSLTLLEHSGEEENTVTQITNAIRHLKRVFVEKPQVFREKNDQRRVPSDIENGDLKGLSKWLIIMTASRSKHCRDISMELFINIQPLSGTNDSLSQFIQKNVNNLIGIYEQHLSKYPTLSDVDVVDDSSVVLKWMQGLLCLIDGYIFIMKHSLCEVNLQDENSMFFNSVTYYLKNLQDISIDQALHLIFKNPASVPHYTALNKEQFLNLKASCNLAILKLCNVIANDEVLCQSSHIFWNENLWKLILNATFNPITLGFDDRKGGVKFTEILTLLLNSIARKLPENKVDDLVKVLKGYIQENISSDIDLKRNVNQKQRGIVKALILLQSSHLNKTFNTETFSSGLIDKLMTNFYNNKENNIICISPLSETTLEYCSLVLEFALHNPNEYKTLLNHLFQNLLVNCEEMSDIHVQSSFGAYFLSKFGDVIVTYVIENFDMFLSASEVVDQVVKLSTCVLGYLEKNKKLYSGSFGSLSDSFLAKWFLFEMYFEENSIDQGLDFVKQLWRIFSNHLRHTDEIQKWIVSLLQRDEIMMTNQEGSNLYLNIFTIAAEIVVQYDSDSLRAALDKFKLKLYQFVASNTETSAVTEKLLAVLPLVKNLNVFEFLLEFYVENTTVHVDLSYLLKVFMVNQEEQNQQAIIQKTYDFVTDNQRNFDQRKSLAEDVLPYLLKESNYNVFETFFVNNIKKVINNLQNLTDYGLGIIDFLLVELLFLRIPIGSEERTYCAITEASESPKLKAVLLKAALDAFKNSKLEENKEHERLFKCSAYKASASIISNSVKTENFYEKLFIREENKQDILWNSLINTEVTYNFTMEFDSYPKRKKVLVNIRDELRQQNDQNRSKTLRYIESQRLFNSSLSEDVTKFDFTNTVLRTNTTHTNSGENEGEMENLGTRVLQAELTLEATEINNHELMGTVCGIIEHIFKSGMCQLPENDDEMVEFPKWMEGIRNLLLNPGTHKNIKIFWVKVLDNMIHIFGYFARYFMEPLLLFLNDKVAGNNTNYFVTDVIVMITSWTSQIQPNRKEAELASNLLKYLVENLSNDRQDSFKYNLELIKILVENWKDYITVPHDSLFQKLNFDTSDRKVEIGIHLTSIFLVNKIIPCDNSAIKAFWNKLVGILKSSLSTIYKPCSETVGLMLKYFKMNNMEEDIFRNEVSKCILNTAGCDINKYASCIEGVAIHYPDILDLYHLTKIFNRLPQADPNLQKTFLKVVLKRVDYLADITDFKSEDWSKYIENQNADVQLITLEIILKTYQILKQEKLFKGIIKTVCKNLLNPNHLCRHLMYDILIAVLEHGDLEDADITDLCKEVLIQGLVDSDKEIRDKIRKFWSESLLMPSAIATKFPYLMSDFYLTKAEEHFLGYVSYFLLDSIKPKEYEKEIFEHPLEDCDFEEYKLQTNWRLQHPSVVPMFAETLRTYTEGLDDLSASNFGVLRATQNDLTFAPTQQTLRERHISQVISLESSLIGGNMNANLNENDGFVNPNAIQLSEKYKLPKRRFLKDKSKISVGFAHRAVADRIQKVVKRFDAAKEREKKVTIYRSYRKGDFPDIQITLGSILKPLQMLVLHDGELSKILFSEIYKALAEKLKSNKQEFSEKNLSNEQEFSENILSSIKNIFTNSVQYNANLFSTLLDILLTSNYRLDPALLSSVCQQSGLISVGTLLIEEYLISTDDFNQASTSKRGVSADCVETRHWLKLAELYKELQEWNLVRTIFLEKTNCKDGVQKAILFESEKMWRDAQEKYQELLNDDLSADHQDFYYESLFKCLAHLGEWEKLPGALEMIMPKSEGTTWDALWDNDWYQQKILPWYVSAQVKQSLFSGSDSPDFLIDFNKSLRVPEQADHLKNKFSEELCILWLTQKDTAEATQYLKNSLDNFLSEWQLLNPMFGNLRFNKVLHLQNLIEIDRFLDVESRITEDTSEDNLKQLTNYWKSTQKEFLPSIIFSEAKLLYRRLFIKLLLEKLEKNNSYDLIKDLKKTKILLDIDFMNTAIEEENFYMVRKYFKEYSKMKHLSLTQIHGNLLYLFSKLVKRDPKLKIEKLLDSAYKFNSVIETSTDSTQLMTSSIKLFDISEKVTEVLTGIPDLYSTMEAAVSKVFGNIDERSPTDIAFDKLKTAALKNLVSQERNDTQIQQITKALVKLAYFVQEKQDQENDFVLFVLRAMKLGSKEARQLFPCILLKDSLMDDIKDVFVTETKDIPTWMFLGWIPQLLANVDSSKVIALSDIILKIARTYPQSIMYAYRLSKENYNITDSVFEEETKSLIEQLDQLLLNDPLVDKFLSGLAKVSVPLVSLEYYLKQMINASNVSSIIKFRDNLLEDMFRDDSDSRDFTYMQGNMYKSIKDLKAKVREINSQQPSKVKDILNSLNEKRKDLLNKQTKRMSKMLKDYCPWLANFSGGRMHVELEIPGQYSGEKLPLVQHHVKISGFRGEVSVMSSLRKPIKITMIGMDSKEYPFLIKFGEDIRQDQRIQQLFILMNNIFASHNKNHNILTYQVVPLTSKLGIIQWVDPTVSLEDFLKKSVKDEKRVGIFDQICDKYKQFFIKGPNWMEIHGSTAMKKDRNKVIPFYQSLVNMLPWDILRKSIWSVSLTTESFIAFRDNFIKSYATICACHWILGIGDRHLQNSKVCIKNGRVLGIDFGHAFGTATQILPVPELVPIRLTPHLLGLMEPLKEKGAFRDVMIDCLRSLRQNNESLLATMNVFVQEPSVDWLDNAKKFEASDPQTHEWYPLQKIDQAKRKLQGAASNKILIEDLKSSSLNKNKPAFVKAYVSLVEGDQRYDLRARLNIKETLSVEDQVDSLLDHATDHNLLGRMYVGWSPYV